MADYVGFTIGRVEYNGDIFSSGEEITVPEDVYEYLMGEEALWGAELAVVWYRAADFPSMNILELRDAADRLGLSYSTSWTRPYMYSIISTEIRRLIAGGEPRTPRGDWAP